MFQVDTPVSDDIKTYSDLISSLLDFSRLAREPQKKELNDAKQTLLKSLHGFKPKDIVEILQMMYHIAEFLQHEITHEEYKKLQEVFEKNLLTFLQDKMQKDDCLTKPLFDSIRQAMRNAEMERDSYLPKWVENVMRRSLCTSMGPVLQQMESKRRKIDHDENGGPPQGVHFKVEPNN